MHGPICGWASMTIFRILAKSQNFSEPLPGSHSAAKYRQDFEDSVPYLQVELQLNAHLH